MPNCELKTLPGPAQAVWSEAYQTAVKALRESGVDAVLVNSRARRAADLQVGLYWEWDEYKLKWRAKSEQVYSGKSVELVWDETKHPRWPSGTGVSPGGEGGGRFRPKAGGAGVADKSEEEENIDENKWVSRAKEKTVADIGQLSKEDRKHLNKAVRAGIIKKGKGGSFGIPKTVYGPLGADFEKERKEALAEFLRLAIMEGRITWKKARALGL